MAFEKYWEDKKAYDEAHKNDITYVTPELSNAPMFNHSILFKNIEDRDNMTDAELRYFIHMNFMVILNNIFDSSVKHIYTAAFKDSRFLDALIDVLHKIPYIEPDVVIRLNLIAYHYITQPENYPENSIDNKILDRMMTISKIINQSKSIALSKFHMPELIENYLLLSRYSDFNLEVCVKRVNLMLVSSPSVISFLGKDNILDASEKVIEFLAKLLMELYKVEEWVFVLPYYMVDVLPQYNENDPNTLWVTPVVESMDSNMSLAVLKILDTMLPDSQSLRAVLISYAEGYRLLNYKKPVKFSFRTISNEYTRLRSVMDYLEQEEHIYLP